MDVLTKCPVCGIHVTVKLTREEFASYQVTGLLPVDFKERSICNCCLDDGFNYSYGIFGLKVV